MPSHERQPGQRKRVAIVIGHEPLPPLSRQRLVGVRRLTRERRCQWRIALFQPQCDPAEIEAFGPDGVLLGAEQAFAITRRVPSVWTVEEANAGTPFVEVDDEQIGRLAALHLLERRFRRFVCAGVGADWSLQRHRGFAATLAEAGHACGFVAVADPEPGREGQPLAAAAVRPWVAGLPRHTGLFVTQDAVAFAVLRACRELGRVVPDDLAVLGVDDVDLDCELTDPPLSSVENPMQTVGYRGAEALHRLLHGDRDVPDRIRVRSPGVHARQSTDVTAVEDDLVAEAIALMRGDLMGFGGVGGLADRLGVSRSTLHRRFVRSVGQGPQQELLRLRVQRAEELLGTSAMTVQEVALRCGFTHATHLNRVFREVHGATPGAWRDRDGRSGEPPASGGNAAGGQAAG